MEINIIEKIYNSDYIETQPLNNNNQNAHLQKNSDQASSLKSLKFIYKKWINFLAILNRSTFVSAIKNIISEFIKLTEIIWKKIKRSFYRDDVKLKHIEEKNEILNDDSFHYKLWMKIRNIYSFFLNGFLFSKINCYLMTSVIFSTILLYSMFNMYVFAYYKSKLDVVLFVSSPIILYKMCDIYIILNIVIELIYEGYYGFDKEILESLYYSWWFFCIFDLVLYLFISYIENNIVHERF